MLVTMLMAAQLVQVTPPPTAAPESDVVVIGRRLRDWRGSIKSGSGPVACTTTRSTGDTEIDAIGCMVLQRCVSENQNAIVAADGKGVKQRERRNRMAAVNAAMTVCMNEGYPPAIQELADRRAVAGATP